MKYTCPIRGTASATRIHEEPMWVHADPEIHVSDELLEDVEARAWIEERYSIDERCTHVYNAHHARLIEASP